MASPLMAGAAALMRARNAGMKADDIIRRFAARGAVLCGTRVRQVDVVAALLDKNPPATICP